MNEIYQIVLRQIVFDIQSLAAMNCKKGNVVALNNIILPQMMEVILSTADKNIYCGEITVIEMSFTR